MGKFTRYWAVCGVLVLGFLAGCRSNKGGCCGSSNSCGGCGTTSATPAVAPSATYPYGASGVAPGAMSPVYNTAQSPAVTGQPTMSQPASPGFGR